MGDNMFNITLPNAKSMQSLHVEEIDELHSTPTALMPMASTHSNISGISAAYSALSPTVTTRSAASSTVSSLSQTVIVKGNTHSKEETVEKENNFVNMEDGGSSMPEPKTFDLKEDEDDMIPSEILSINPNMDIIKKSSLDSSHTNTP